MTIVILLSLQFGNSQNYTKWLAIEIEHSYFSNSTSPITLVLTQKTSEIIKRNNVLFRQVPGAYEFYIGLPSADIGITSELENLGILEFEVILKNPLFFNYTEVSILTSGEYYLFKNTPNNTTIQIEKVSSEELDEQMNNNSIGILQINANDLQSEKLTLSFEARKVFYQYQIVLASNHNFEINDIKVFGSEQEEYAGPIEKTIAGGQKVLVFTSTSVLPLKQTLDVNPNLKLHYTNNGSSISQDLEMKLPNPSPENLIKTENGEYICSTIVYI